MVSWLYVDVLSLFLFKDSIERSHERLLVLAIKKPKFCQSSATGALSSWFGLFLTALPKWPTAMLTHVQGSHHGSVTPLYILLVPLRAKAKANPYHCSALDGTGWHCTATKAKLARLLKEVSCIFNYRLECMSEIPQYRKCSLFEINKKVHT